MIRNGALNALEYDFEIKNIASDLGINIELDDSINVNGDSVAYYILPISGERVEEFDTDINKITYLCPLVLSVKAATNGKINNIIKAGETYSVSVINSHGYEIVVSGLDVVYVKYGQNVTAGQIIGKLSSNGFAVLSVNKNGVACNPSDIF